MCQKNIVRECISTQKEISTEFRRELNGQEYWYEVISTPFGRHFFGKPCVLFITKDVTKYKCIEQSLREREKQLRAVVEDQTELIGRFLPDCTITFANQAWCRYFGKTLKEVTGSSVMSYIPEKDREKVFHRFCSLTPDHSVIVNGQGQYYTELLERKLELITSSLGRKISQAKLKFICYLGFIPVVVPGQGQVKQLQT